MPKVHLFATYYVDEVNAEAWEKFFVQHQALVFPDEESISFDSIFTDDEKTKLARLKANVASSLQLYFLIYDGETPIGWHFGFQRSELEYFMANTGILPHYQHRGIYSAFLTYAINRILDEGFQFITSIHRPDNNAVLIPKLKAGFLIQSTGFLIQTMILESNYGVMLQLVYPAKAVYRRLFDARIGTHALNREISQAIRP